MRFLRPLSLLAVFVLIAAGCGDDDVSGSAASSELPSTAEIVNCEEAGPLAKGPATFEHDGIQREYVISVPSAVVDEPAPLLFDFHGFGGGPASQEATSRLGELATERGYVVITPQGEPLTVTAETAGGIDTSEVDGVAFWNIFGAGGMTLGADIEDLGDIDPDEIGADDIGFV